MTFPLFVDFCHFTCYTESNMEDMMGELETNEELNIEVSFTDDTNTTNINTVENNLSEENNSTNMSEYKEVDEPCVALTIIGENRLTDTEVFVRRGIKYTIKAFFSAIVLTIMNMFI